MHRIAFLDSLRGIAALIVVFHHYFSHFSEVFEPIKQHKPYLFRLLSFISDLNVEAVLFFFILSGFCIQLSIKKIDLSKKEDINYYLYKRFKRILPIYLIGLAFTFLLGLIAHQYQSTSYSLKNLLGNLLFLQTSKNVGDYWFTPYGDNGPLWSLSYEMFFYLFFPCYYICLLKISKLVKCVANLYEIGLTLSLALSLIGIISKQLLFNPFSAFLSYFFIWFSGVYLASLYQRRVFNDKLVISYFALIILLFLFTIYFPSDTLGNLISGGSIFLVFYAFYRFVGLRDNIVFASITKITDKTLYFIGVGSYALYILHFPILMVFNNKSALWAGVTIILLIPLCIKIEESLVRPKYSFLKLNYIPSYLIGTKSDL